MQIYQAEGMNEETNSNPRYLAAQIIARWLSAGDFPNRMLNIDAKDRAFVTEIVQGVVRWKRPLEWVIKQTAKHLPPPLLKSFLLTGLYQLFMMNQAADYAVVNETVAAAKIKFSSKQADFVNAVLRRVVRDRDQILAGINGQSPGIRFSHPDLLLNRWVKVYGAKKALRLCEWNNTRPNVIIRINTLRPADRSRAFMSQLEQKGILHELLAKVFFCHLQPHPPLSPGRSALAEPGRVPLPGGVHKLLSLNSLRSPPPEGWPACIAMRSIAGRPKAGVGSGPTFATDLPVKSPGNYFPLPHGLRVEDLPGYADGMFLVMDPFAANAIELLNPQPGENILDACAAPGGKTFLIAEKMRLSGKIHAFDASEDRIRIMKANFQRLQISDFIEIKKENVLAITSSDSQKYDRILADVPCSNTGVIRRKPDIRWRFSLKGLGLLVRTQKKMLDRLALVLKPGGTLVYSTCSLEPEENQMLVKAWLKVNPSFCLAAERIFFPPVTGTDGGYAAALAKR